MIRITLLILLPLLAVLNAFTQQPPSATTEVWPEVTLNYTPKPRVRLQLALRKETADETPDSTWETTATISFRVKPVVRRLITDFDDEKSYRLSLAASYEYSRSIGGSTTGREHKVMFDATPRYSLWAKVLIHDRNRFEFRWVNGTYDFWFRNRVRVERGFKINKFHFIPYGSAELIWTKNVGAWNRNQLSAGVEIPFAKRWMADVYFLRKNCNTCAHSDVDAIGFNLNVFLGK